MKNKAFAIKDVLVLSVTLFLLLTVLLTSLSAASRNGYTSQAKNGSQMRWGRLRFPDAAGEVGWSYHPEGDLNLIRKFREDTDINMAFDFGVPHVNNLEDMATYPFIFVHGQHPIRLNPDQRANLREYLRRGGFLFVDDCVLSAQNPDAFFQSMRLEMRRILPGARYVNFARDKNHDIFHCFYDLPDGLPHGQGRDNGLIGVYDEDRLVALMSSGDLHCAWAQWLGHSKEQLCLQMAVNIYIYAMTH